MRRRGRPTLGFAPGVGAVEGEVEVVPRRAVGGQDADLGPGASDAGGEREDAPALHAGWEGSTRRGGNAEAVVIWENVQGLRGAVLGDVEEESFA